MAVNVCRLSGQLPGAACDRVIPEYFVRGAAPTQICQEHYLFSTATQIATVLPSGGGIVSIGPRMIAPAVAVSEAPPELVVASVAPAGASEPPKKKRGFWGRVFGRDKNEKSGVESRRNVGTRK
jgi:hypothetical protein